MHLLTKSGLVEDALRRMSTGSLLVPLSSKLLFADKYLTLKTFAFTYTAECNKEPWGQKGLGSRFSRGEGGDEFVTVTLKSFAGRALVK